MLVPPYREAAKRRPHPQPSLQLGSSPTAPVSQLRMHASVSLHVHWAALARVLGPAHPWLCHSPTAIPVTQIQWPRGMTLRSARWVHVCSTLARVKALTSRALSTSVSSRCCLERRRACTPAGIGTACRVVVQLAWVCVQYKPA